jgi:hypothetical protein
MTPQELLAKHGIKLETVAPGRYYSTCPECSAKRKRENQSKKCLGVLIDDKGACWHCNHCHWSGPEKGAGVGKAMPIETTYNYTEGSEFRFQKIRHPKGYEPRFHIRSRDTGGGWKWGAKGIAKPLYRIDEVTAAIKDGRTILIVEGEKDVDNLWRLEFAATCNFDGAVDVIQNPKAKPKWKAEYSEMLRDADIVILNDNDAPGYAHADVACRLSLGVAKRVRRLDLKQHWPQIPKGGDVSDWLAAGHAKDELEALIAGAPDCVQSDTGNGSGAPIDDDAELERLAKLRALEYERARTAAAEKLGIKRLKLLDDLVKAKRKDLGLVVEEPTGPLYEHWNVTPADHPVDGGTLLRALKKTIRRYVFMNDDQALLQPCGWCFRGCTIA